MASITYKQDDDSGAPGTITLDDVTKTAESGPPYYGRLDNVGDLVFAEFEADNFYSWIRVECIRTSKQAMTIRVVYGSQADGGAGSYISQYSISEKVVENVPISFK